MAIAVLSSTLSLTPTSSSSSYSSSSPSSSAKFPYFPRTPSISLQFTPRKSTPISLALPIEKETLEDQPPPSFLRDSDGSGRSSSVRARFESMIRAVQDTVCQAIELADGGARFKEDTWTRPGGGGGISRVLQNGAVWEKAGVNVSVVYGVMPPEAYRAATASATAADQKPGPVPFFAAGISSVLHPKNPFAPTLHFNYRYCEEYDPQ